MAPSPQLQPDNSTATPFGNSSQSTSTANPTVIALGLTFGAFMIVCFSICACSYRRRRLRKPDVSIHKRRSKTFRRTSIRTLQERQAESDREWTGHNLSYNASLSLASPLEDEQLPPYRPSPIESMWTSGISTGGEDQHLATYNPPQRPSPETTEVSYLASPALNSWSSGQPLLVGLTPPPTPPAPVHVFEARSLL
jgi:hypothetical protein